MEPFEPSQFGHFMDAPAEREHDSPTRFEVVPGAPPSHAEYTESRWLWLIHVKQYQTTKLLLVNGENLVVSSNNSLVVPNDDMVFKGKTETSSRRVVEFYAMSYGVTMLEVRTIGGDYRFALQVRVTPVSGKYPSFIALKAPQQALNSSDTPGPYHMVHTETIKSGTSAADIIAKVHAGINHVTICCHSFTPGVLSIGEGLRIENVDAFKGLKANTGAKVIWIGSCSVAGPAEGVNLCKAIAKNSGCYVVAPGIGTGGYKTPVGRIDFFGPSFPKYFGPSGDLVAPNDFLKLGADLGFTIEGRY